MGTAKKSVRWGLFLLQGAAVAAAIGLFLPKVRVSPGELTAVHAREPALAGSAGCAKCHGESRQASMEAACAACHADIESQIARNSGIHGTLPPGEAADCGRCHGEHKGRQFAPVHPQSFALAGIPVLSRFAHETVDFGLTGKHLELECTKCHRHAEDRELPQGEKRFLGLDQTCTRCHKDVHEGSYGPRCQSCHGQERPFPAVASFRHPDAFPLAGGHGGLACAKCHEPGTIHRAMEAASAFRPASVRECSSCHRSPHGDEFLLRISQPLGIGAKETCARCHSTEKGGFVGPLATLTRTAHASAGFPLTPPHHRQSCTACHEGYGSASSGGGLDAYHRRYPGRKPDDCKACHGDPHRGEFEIGAFKGRDCLSCHARESFAPPDFDMARHDLVFKLEGSHRKLDCAKCHAKPETKGPRDYRGVATDCRSCHQDPHGGQFNKPLYLGGDCRTCHSQTTWRPSTFSVEMHRGTTFALTGAHLGIGCARCHEAPAADGKAAVAKKFTGLAGECASCHADVHAGAFDGAGRPSTIGGKQGCARCHGTDSFRPAPGSAFDHTVWTGFALKGAHSALACAACHGRSAVPDARGRTLGIVSGTSCQSCHSDPHAGQFGPTAAVNCASCHREEGTFKNLLFDHQRNSKFPLDEVHAKVACAKCHQPMAVSDGAKAIRYKPLGTKCRDCHEPRGSR